MADFFSKLGQWLLRIAAGVVIVLALLVGVARLLLPEASRFAEDVRRVAQEASGFEVDFQLLSAGVTLYGPELRLSAVTVSWPGGEQVFAATEIGVTVDLGRLLLQQKVAPAMLHVEGLAVDLEVTDAGVVLLQGRPFDEFITRDASAEGLEQLRVSLDDIDVRFTDRKRGIQPVDARVQQLFASIDSTEVEFEADIRPNPEFAERLEITGLVPIDLLRDRSRLTAENRWNLDLTAEDFRLDPWLKLIDLRDAPVIDSEGTASAAVEFAGLLPVSLSVDADIGELVLAQPDGEPVVYDAVAGAVAWQREGNGWQAVGRGLRFERDKRDWPDSEFLVSQRRNENGTVSWAASTGFVRLDDLMPFVSAIAVPQLAEAGVTGVAEGDVWRLQATAELAAGELREFRLESDFEQLGYIDGDRGIVARGISGSVRADQSGGSLRLATRDAQLGLDAVFRDVLAVTSLEGLAVWRTGDERLRVIASDIYAETPDGGGTASFELATDLAFENPWVDLTAEASMADATQVVKYLPRKVPDKVIAWLSRALEQGSSPGTDFRLRGPLRKFPFREDEGEYLIDIDFRDARMRYAEDWPAIEDASGRLVFSNESLYSVRNQATIGGVRFVDTMAQIADLKQAEIQLVAGGDVSLNSLLRFLRDAPVGERLGDVFPDIRAGGRGDLRTSLQLPLRDLGQWQLQGTLDVNDASVWLRTLEPRFRNVKGRVSIDNTYVTGEGLSATLLDEPVSIRIEPDVAPDAAFSHRATVRGRFPYAKVEDALALPPLGKLDGAADMRADALFPAPRPDSDPFRLIVTSDLEGISSNLPDPLGKPAASREDFAAEVRFPADGAIDISMNLQRGVLADFEYRRDEGRWGLRGGRVRIGTAEETSMGDDGIALTLAADRVRVEDWVEAFSQETDPGSGWPEERGRWEDYFDSVELLVDELEVLGYRFSDTDLRADFGSNSWDVEIIGPWVEGRLDVPFELDSTTTITGDLSRLLLIEPVDNGSVAADEYSASPLNMPGFQGTVTEFALGTMRLGRLVADVRAVPDGIEARSLTMTAPSFTALVSGDWLVVDNAQRSRVHAELESNDVQQALRQLGLAPLLSGNRGKVVTDLIWEGGPGDDIVGASTGTLSMSVRDGAINDIDARGGRLLGLLSVAALPRRLALDFTDLTENKLTFSKISADFRLDFGDAWTCNLGLEGDVADMALVGRTGITAQDYNQVAVVRPQLANLVPVPAAFLGGPTAGVAALLVSQIFKKPISGIGETYYTVSGSWDNSDIARVQRSDLDTTPFADCEAQLPALSPEEVTAIEELLNQPAEQPPEQPAPAPEPEEAAPATTTP